MPTPTLLYHGSRFKQDELKPGFLHTGVLVEWDKTESNKFLYATSVLSTAWELGFASSIEKEFDIDRFHVHKGKIAIQTPESIKIEDLEKIEVYLYTIHYRDEDGWTKNFNEHNNIDTEYKTKQTIRSIESCTKLDVRKWLCNYDVTIEKNLPKIEEGKNKQVVLESNIPIYLKW